MSIILSRADSMSRSLTDQNPHDQDEVTKVLREIEWSALTSGGQRGHTVSVLVVTLFQ